MFKTLKNLAKGNRVLEIEAEQQRLCLEMTNMDYHSREYATAYEQWVELDLERETILVKRQFVAGAVGITAVGAIVAYKKLKTDDTESTKTIEDNCEYYEKGYDKGYDHGYVDGYDYRENEHLDEVESLGH